MKDFEKVSKDWWKESAMDIPKLITETPGPKSKRMHANTARYMKGLSSQVKLFPVCFEEGSGITLTMLTAINTLIFHQVFMLLRWAIVIRKYQKQFPIGQKS